MRFPVIILVNDGSFSSVSNEEDLPAAVYELVAHGDLLCILDTTGGVWVWSDAPAESAYETGHWIPSTTSAPQLCVEKTPMRAAPWADRLMPWRRRTLRNPRRPMPGNDGAL